MAGWKAISATLCHLIGQHSTRCLRRVHFPQAGAVRPGDGRAVSAVVQNASRPAAASRSRSFCDRQLRVRRCPVTASGGDTKSTTGGRDAMIGIGRPKRSNEPKHPREEKEAQDRGEGKVLGGPGEELPLPCQGLAPRGRLASTGAGAAEEAAMRKAPRPIATAGAHRRRRARTARWDRRPLAGA